MLWVGLQLTLLARRTQCFHCFHLSRCVIATPGIPLQKIDESPTVTWSVVLSCLLRVLSTRWPSVPIGEYRSHPWSHGQIWSTYCVVNRCWVDPYTTCNYYSKPYRQNSYLLVKIKVVHPFAIQGPAIRHIAEVYQLCGPLFETRTVYAISDEIIYIFEVIKFIFHRT